MTNLSTRSRQPWLTRGRLLVGLRLGLGALVSFGLMTLGVRPLFQTVVGPLKLSSPKISVSQVGVHQIHIRQLAVRALSCLQ